MNTKAYQISIVKTNYKQNANHTTEYTRSYYRKESAAVTHKVENSQPIINIEIIIHCMY